jgi:predicted nucleic acid-binding Zn ribbon protein
MTESAARQAVGAHDSAIKLLKSSPELAKLLPKRVCLICGDSLLHQHLGRKYCSSRCQSKADYDRRRVAAGHPKPKRQGDHAKRDQAVELYVHGLNCSSIAQHLGIPKKQAKNWIYYHGAKKLAEISGDVTLQRPLRHRLNEATNVEAWASILHEAAESSDDSESVVLVCGTIHGSGAVGRYADIVLEKLKQNLVDGTRFAFCNVLYNAITTIEWCGETFHLTRSLKLSGTFAWPSEELGDFVMVSEKAFLYLIAYQKTTRRNKYIIENP